MDQINQKTKDMKNLLIAGLLLLVGALHAQNGNINPDILNKAWKAYWISASDKAVTDYGVFRFRKEINLAEKPKTYVVHVSADNRYKLWINDKLVSIGPASGNIYNWNFETIDLAPYLNLGKNEIEATVWNDGPLKALSQFSVQTAFIMQGNTKEEFNVNTNKSWECAKIKGYTPIVPRINGYYAAGPGELLDMNCLANPEENKWESVTIIGLGNPKGSNSILPAGKWMLTPSLIPQMEMTVQRIKRLRYSNDISIPSSFPEKQTNVTIPKNTSISLLLDQTYLTNAYPTLICSKGKNASISIKYAETLYNKDFSKGNRNEVKEKTFIGKNDSIICNGLENQNYTTLSWRTYRYIQLDIKTQNEELIINDIYGTFTGYPFQNKTTFSSNKEFLHDVLDIGWRTARLCAVETYFDCPYYEQLQYVGDTRIQAMVSYYNSGDDRLARNAINLIDNSRFPEGITQSRYPSTELQIIPPYSLFWIGMVYDFYRYRNDNTYVKSKLQGVRQILDFFSNYQQQDGSLKNLPYWNFTDWVEGNSRSWKFGTSPNDGNGNSAVLDLQLLWAYQLASELESDLGETCFVNRYTEQVEKLKQAINTKYWDSSKQMFADNADKKCFSQHANSLAILTGIVNGSQAEAVYCNMTNDEQMVKASIYFQYYLYLAMTKAGFGNAYLDQLGIWQKNIELGMTTWGETSDVERTRSDCHAWGASPNIEFFRTVLGIESDAPGFRQVKIEPHLGALTNVSGSISHWNGVISASYTLKGSKWSIAIKLPEDIKGIFIWKNKTYTLRTGENSFSFSDMK